MSMCEEEKYIREVYESLPDKTSIANVIRRKPGVSEFLYKRFPMLQDKKYSVGMKVYWLMNGIEDFPTCTECGKPNRTNRCYANGYRTEFCSRKCSHGKVSESRKAKTNMERYGVANPMQNKEISDRSKNRVRELYGVDNVFQSEEIKAVAKETKLRKYGNENYVNRDKAAKTNLERYGAENVFGSKEVQNRIRETNLSKYGSEVVSKSPEIKKRMHIAMLKRMVHLSYEKYLMTNPFSEPNFTEEYYLAHRGKTREYEFRCRKCGGTYTSRVHNGCIRRCPKCYSSVTTSGKEQELFDFIKNIYSGPIERKNRMLLKEMGSKEIDMYLPEKKVAIEFDGMYWHSELNGVGPRYHVSKTDICESQGIQLIHIFEDEWDGKRNIVESRLRNILGKDERTIYARCCSVKHVGTLETDEFLEENHIQGHVRSAIRLGLYLNDELVSVMTFCRPRIALGNRKNNMKDEGSYELLRFCNKLNCRVVGGAGKLLKHFERTVSPKILVSYADRRWSTGNLYRKLGFSLDHISPPNYWYLKNGCDERFHRFNFRKSVLKDKLKKFDPSKTEVENMRMNKYTRIWDCGNLVFVKEYR